jgi:hypothetical protein
MLSTHVVRRLPVPVPRIPWEVKDESRLKNPINWRFLTWLEQILCDPRGAAKNTIWGKVVDSPESGPW